MHEGDSQVKFPNLDSGLLLSVLTPRAGQHKIHFFSLLIFSKNVETLGALFSFSPPNVLRWILLKYGHTGELRSKRRW